jgi:hypothetical protein
MCFTWNNSRFEWTPIMFHVEQPAFAYRKELPRLRSGPPLPVSAFQENCLVWHRTQTPANTSAHSTAIPSNSINGKPTPACGQTTRPPKPPPGTAAPRAPKGRTQSALVKILQPLAGPGSGDRLPGNPALPHRAGVEAHPTPILLVPPPETEEADHSLSGLLSLVFSSAFAPGDRAVEPTPQTALSKVLSMKPPAMQREPLSASS